MRWVWVSWRMVGELCFIYSSNTNKQRTYGTYQLLAAVSDAESRRQLSPHYLRRITCSMDVTQWLAWFLDALQRAVDQAQHTLDAVLVKTRFWQRWASTPRNERQVKLLTRLLDGFEGKLTSSKWAAIAKCSSDTALRDINDLVERGVLRKTDAGGRSTSYELNELPQS
ncbi:MAG: Fic family protein [Burkholderiaceae bacterium]|nr:Fic family protein [Burkholderiaceae bacterium]